ncbi:hypothetical protein Hanom_Chr17g01536541 [Helianthus anomalus]
MMCNYYNSLCFTSNDYTTRITEIDYFRPTKTKPKLASSVSKPNQTCKLVTVGCMVMIKKVIGVANRKVSLM